jgi:hypothetical protein
MMLVRILDNNGIDRQFDFLLDTGADRTVICAIDFEKLRLPSVRPVDQIGGVGGIADSVDVTTQIGLRRDDGQWITLRGTYAACLQRDALDMSVLGRDVLNMFAVIVDRGADHVMLLHGAHTYAIQRRE